jgi:glycosyltransferase involved in cell wall biosynthesis
MDNAVWIVCRDEEFYIDMAIESVISKVDGIFILDTGSKDKTLSVISNFKQDKIVLEQKDFGSNFRFGCDLEGVEDRCQRQVEARNYAMKRAIEIFNPQKFIIQLDADEIFNDRFFEILESLEGDCLGHSTDLSITSHTVSSHPLDIEIWNGIKLFDPHVRVWRASLPIHWAEREGRHVVPRLDGYRDYLDIPNRVVTSNNVHFHLHHSFGPKCKKPSEDLLWSKAKRFEITVSHPLPDYTVERWKMWEGLNHE